ncbi:MAG: hypothetical protein KJO69_07975 [Gammaproteobacteria bacterium]|nr:hypothetical protein [Gammaproteobacteria bacterium]
MNEQPYTNDWDATWLFDDTLWLFSDTLIIIRKDPLAFKSVTEEWLKQNSAVWERFYDLADKMRRTGRKRYGAKCILEVMRYETDARDAEKTFKLNNNYTSGLARLYNAVTGTDFFGTRG